MGHGASGRNAGHLTPVIGKDLPTLALLFRRRARPLIELVELAIAHVERTIAEPKPVKPPEPVLSLDDAEPVPPLDAAPSAKPLATATKPAGGR